MWRAQVAARRMRRSCVKRWHAVEKISFVDVASVTSVVFFDVWKDLSVFLAVANGAWCLNDVRAFWIVMARVFLKLLSEWDWSLELKVVNNEIVRRKIFRANLVAAPGWLTWNHAFTFFCTARVRVHCVLIEVAALCRRRRVITMPDNVGCQKVWIVWRVGRRLKNWFFVRLFGRFELQVRIMIAWEFSLSYYHSKFKR